MALLGDIFGAGGVAGALQPLIAKVADLIPDPAAKAAAIQAMQEKQDELDAAVEAAQSAINLKDAESESFWKSGARPGALWVCVTGLAWNTVVAPMFTYAAAMCGYHPMLPTLDTATTMPLMISLLGLGTLRSYEKIQGVAGSQASQLRIADQANVAAQAGIAPTLSAARRMSR